MRSIRGSLFPSVSAASSSLSCFEAFFPAAPLLPLFPRFAFSGPCDQFGAAIPLKLSVSSAPIPNSRPCCISAWSGDQTGKSIICIEEEEPPPVKFGVHCSAICLDSGAQPSAIVGCRDEPAAKFMPQGSASTFHAFPLSGMGTPDSRGWYAKGSRRWVCRVPSACECLGGHWWSLYKSCLPCLLCACPGDHEYDGGSRWFIGAGVSVVRTCSTLRDSPV